MIVFALKFLDQKIQIPLTLHYILQPGRNLIFVVKQRLILTVNPVGGRTSWTILLLYTADAQAGHYLNRQIVTASYITLSSSGHEVKV